MGFDAVNFNSTAVYNMGESIRALSGKVKDFGISFIYGKMKDEGVKAISEAI